MTWGMSPRARLASVLAALVAAILIPFLLWGDRLDSLAPALLSGGNSAVLVAVAGVVLLIIDLVLPIPSSVISISLCLLLGPALGGLVIALGMTGGFACGYLVGQMLPREALRQWVGTGLWDALARKATHSAPVWIMVSRPVPVLAEATAVISGSLGVPFRMALLAALMSSLAVAACYAIAVMIGFSQGGFGLAFASSLALAGLLWSLSRRWRRGIHV